MKYGKKTAGNYQTKSKKLPKKGVYKSSKFMKSKKAVEKKFFDVENVYSCPLTATFGSAVNISPIIQGIDQTNRIGRQTTIRSAQIRVQTVTQAGTTPSQIRYVVVYDKQTNGAVPLKTDVFAGSANFLSHYNLDNSDRFIILLDKITDSQQSSLLPISDKAFVKCALDQQWGGVTGSAISCNTGLITLFMANNSDTTIGASSQVDYTSRIRFTDQ